MLLKDVFKNLLVVTFSIGICSFTYAEQPALQRYIELVSSEKYQLESTFSYTDVTNTKEENYRKVVVLTKDSDKDFIACYGEKTILGKHEYYLVKKYSNQDKNKYFAKYSKKPIEDIHMDWNKTNIKGALESGFIPEVTKNELQNTHDEIYSMLGPITERNNKLKHYQVQYKRSGQWQRNGILYDFDEYALIEPISGTLIMCYEGGKLAKCMKSQSRQIITNDGFGKYQLNEKKAVVLDLKQFDDDVDDSLFFKQ